MNAHGFTPREPAPAWRLDALWDVLHFRSRAAARRIVHDAASYADELDGLMAGPASDILDADPALLDAIEAFEDEIADGLADDAAAVEQADARANPLPPGTRPVLHHVDLPGQPFTGLPAYYPPITEPRGQALIRQKVSIFSTIADAARIGAARRELHRRRAAELDLLADPSPSAKAALTRRLHREVAAEHGFAGGRIPSAPETMQDRGRLMRSG